MELQNSFTVPADVATAWNTLLDVEAIAPCMPGATLESVSGDEFTGHVKVKLGPVSMTYGGQARFLSKDATTHTAVIEGNGKESRGTGTARAIVTCVLTEDAPNQTRVDVSTDLTITGKAAQFGRGVMQDVAGRLVTQFAGNLGTVISARASSPDSGTAAPTLVPTHTEALDLGSVAAAPVLKRVVPAVIGVIVLVGLIWFIANR